MQNYRDRKYVSGSRTGAEEILNYKGVQRNLGDRSAGALSISWLWWHLHHISISIYWLSSNPKDSTLKWVNFTLKFLKKKRQNMAWKEGHDKYWRD